MNQRPLSVLFDLRPAFDGHFGIPQETRLTFPLLRDLDGLEVTGLIHHPTLTLARGRKRRQLNEQGQVSAKMISVMSRLVVSATPRIGWTGPLKDTAASAFHFPWLQFQSMLKNRIPVDHFDSAEFGDFLWRSLFFKSLPPDEFERCRTARYATLWPSWRALHATACVPWPWRYARIDTTGYDVLLAQTPWPGIVDRRTQLVVRYHNSTPVFLPHTLRKPRLHRFMHMQALQTNAKAAVFACVSEFSRTKLLQIFPELERRSFVVHNCISSDYFPVTPAPDVVAEIVTSSNSFPVPNSVADAFSERLFWRDDRRRGRYDGQVVPQDFRFILMVSTLEPRKNHLGLLAAWEVLRSKTNVPIALVLVGSPGWGNRRLLQAMRKWQQHGELFHLSAVPLSAMRALYATAAAVVCPSISEGFDLPAVEALRCGGAVAASDIPVHREILGNAAAYFDPYSVAGMCETLLRVLGEETQKELRRNALLQAAKFNRSEVQLQWENLFEYCRSRRDTWHAGK